VEGEAQLRELLPVARREAQAAFGNDEIYLEKLVRRARHVEVQILGDQHGTLVHLFERDCTAQRRNQKVVERAPAVFLSDAQRAQLCAAALAIGRAASYRNAGTVEFLQDADTGDFYFIEVNPRIQVEHTVTECATGIDLVKAQIRIAGGARIGEPASGVPAQSDIHISAHALQCRITTEDPENNFIPDYGTITAYRSPAGFGVRLDAGTAYTGAIISRSYDSLLVKVTAWAPTPEETIARMHRALWEFRIRGVVSNLRFLDQLITHPRFASGDYTTRFIEETPELFQWQRKRDRASRILSFIGTTIVNGHPETRARPRPAAPARAEARGLRRVGGLVEPHVLAPRPPRRARGSAIDVGGRHREHEASVGAGIARRHRGPRRALVHAHARSLPVLHDHALHVVTVRRPGLGLHPRLVVEVSGWSDQPRIGIVRSCC